MKKLILSLVVVLFAMSYEATAQVFTIGPKLGISSTNINPSESASNFAAGDTKVSYHLGAFARLKVAAIYIQPEIYFNSVNAVYIDNNTNEEYKFEKNKVDIPVLVGFKAGPVRINAGPVASINTNTDIDNNAVNEYKSAIFAYQAGIGLDISNLTLDVRYQGNLNDQGTFNNGNGSFKVNQILFSLGLKLL